MINEYKCPKCGYQKEEIEKYESNQLCEKCKVWMKKIPSAVSWFRIDGNAY